MQQPHDIAWLACHPYKADSSDDVSLSKQPIGL
jgi:hypothetical protein